jgi:hypothetical protein
MACHVLGMAELAASPVEQARQFRAAKRAPGLFLDALTAQRNVVPARLFPGAHPAPDCIKEQGMTSETTPDAILEERPMTTRSGTAVTPGVFDAGLPWLDYFDLEYQDDPHRFNAAALAQAPVVMGPLGPAVLAYDLVQTVLRDPRFRPPRGLGLEAQGITTGPLWDRAVSSILSLDGGEHHRLRRLVSRSFTPRLADRLRATMVEVITGLVDSLTRRGHCDVVADIARPYPIPVICELLGAPAGDWQRFSAWTDDVFKIFNFNVASDPPPRHPGRLRRARRLHRRHGRRPPPHTGRRPRVGAHPGRRRRRPAQPR